MKKIIFLLTVSLSISTSGLAQQSSVSEVESIAAPLIKKWRLHDKERIYLESDKKYYAPGEIIWFKAYIVDSLNNQITYTNKFLYVDLVDDKDTVVHQLIMHGDQGSSNGSIALNDSLLQGHYWIRVYTKKMIAGNSRNMGVRAVYIVNGKRKNSLSSSHTNKAAIAIEPKAVADIYPEGGWIISGTNSVVALKVHDQNGNPIAAPGVIKDNRGTVIAEFVTNDQGAARFNLTPKWFGKYKLYIKNKDAYDSAGVLPSINPFAAQLSVVSQNEQSIRVRVMLEDSIFTRDYTTYILGLSKDSVCFAGVGKGMYELDIPVSAFPGGVAKLLLFNAKKELASRRNVFINKKNVNVAVIPNKQTYAARENVKMNIAVTDAAGKPLLAALTVSVVDARFADTANDAFNNPLSTLAPEDADLLMLINSEQDESLSILQQTKSPQALNDTNDHLILKGQVINKKKEPVAAQEVLLTSKGNNAFYETAKTDAAGNFSFALPDYNDGTQFNLQMNNAEAQNRDYVIVAEPVKLPRFTTPAMLKAMLVNEAGKTDETIVHRIESLLTDSRSISLQPVTVKTTDTKGSGKKKNNADIITQEMLQSGGVNNAGQAVLRSGKFHLVGSYLMSGGSNGFAPAASDEPIVIMDGIPVTVASDNQEASPVLSYLKTIPTNEIEYIKLLTGNEGSMYGVRGGHGVIEIHSASKLNNSNPSAKAATTVSPKGFHVPAAFIMPEYNNKDERKSKSPDLRTTIYWNGDLITDSSGKAQINYFTADVPATYIVRVTGITVKGDKFVQTTTIKRN